MAERLCVRDDPTLGALVVLLAVVAGFAIWVGLIWSGNPPPVTEMVTPRGETVTLFGEGVYRFNDVFRAWAFRAQDWVDGPSLLAALGDIARDNRSGDVYARLTEEGQP